MGRKKRKETTTTDLDRPFCWYCNRGFDTEAVLIMHQKSVHFKCPYKECRKKLGTSHALLSHMFQVHKSTITE
jgi:hypothetical protein